MRNSIEINVRVFPVQIRDNRSGMITEDMIALDKAQLQAAQQLGIDSNNLIRRLYNRQGYHVQDIGRPVKAGISIDLLECYQKHAAAQIAIAGKTVAGRNNSRESEGVKM